jgi:Cu2+-containing amine oxidase
MRMFRASGLPTRGSANDWINQSAGAIGVVRSAAAMGNYDDVVEYVFHQDGSIRIAVGATGIDATKASRADR